jgi:hypothetical protein
MKYINLMYSIITLQILTLDISDKLRKLNSSTHFVSMRNG